MGFLCNGAAGFLFAARQVFAGMLTHIPHLSFNSGGRDIAALVKLAALCEWMRWSVVHFFVVCGNSARFQYILVALRTNVPFPFAIVCFEFGRPLMFLSNEHIPCDNAACIYGRVIWSLHFACSVCGHQCSRCFAGSHQSLVSLLLPLLEPLPHCHSDLDRPTCGGHLFGVSVGFEYVLRASMFCGYVPLPRSVFPCACSLANCISRGFDLAGL